MEEFFKKLVWKIKIFLRKNFGPTFSVKTLCIFDKKYISLHIWVFSGFRVGFAIFRVWFGSGLSYFFRVRVGFGLVKNPRVGSGSRVFGYPTHHYLLLLAVNLNHLPRSGISWSNYVFKIKSSEKIKGSYQRVKVNS